MGFGFGSGVGFGSGPSDTGVASFGLGYAVLRPNGLWVLHLLRLRDEP